VVVGNALIPTRVSLAIEVVNGQQVMAGVREVEALRTETFGNSNTHDAVIVSEVATGNHAALSL